MQLPKHRWVWLGTASEIPTPTVVQKAKQIITSNPNLDLVYVPRKLYSFGFYSQKSPWGIKYYPFLVNRECAIIRNLIHRNFQARDRLTHAAYPQAKTSVCTTLHTLQRRATPMQCDSILKQSPKQVTAVKLWKKLSSEFEIGLH